MGVALQETCRDALCFRSLHSLLDNGRLVFAPGHQNQSACAKNGADPHRDGEARDIFLPLKVARRIPAREVVEGDEARARRLGGARLIEADVAGAADSQDLQVNAPGGSHGLFITFATRKNLLHGYGPIRHVDLVGGDVDVVEQLRVHEMPVALRVVAPEAEVFIEIERHDVCETQPLLLVQSDQFPVKWHRSRTRCQTEHGLFPCGLFFQNQCFHLLRQGRAGFMGGGEDDRFDFLELFSSCVHSRGNIRIIRLPASFQTSG